MAKLKNDTFHRVFGIAMYAKVHFKLQKRQLYVLFEAFGH